MEQSGRKWPQRRAKAKAAMVRRGSIPAGIVEPDYFLAHSGHGHWSEPQPVHAWCIMRAS
jgi:hypothetical protein